MAANVTNEEEMAEFNYEEFVEYKKKERDEVYALLDEGTKEVVGSPENFENYLKMQCRLDKMSASNVILISKQCPAASCLKTYDEWRDEHVRIARGEKAISILEPRDYTKKDGTIGITYNIKKVFDVTQTYNGKRTPAVSADHHPKYLVAALLDSSPVDIEIVDNLKYPNFGAYYDNDKSRLMMESSIKEPTILCQSLARELSLAELSLNSDVYSRSDSSALAVASAYMLCRKYGVDTENFALDEIPNDMKDKNPKEIRACLTKVRNTFSDINSRVITEIYRQNQNRQIEQER